MRILIMADMEGISGIIKWEQVNGGEPMYEEAGYCSSCDRWISREDVPRKPLPAWMVVLVLMALAGLVFSALRLF